MSHTRIWLAFGISLLVAPLSGPYLERQFNNFWSPVEENRISARIVDDSCMGFGITELDQYKMGRALHAYSEDMARYDAFIDCLKVEFPQKAFLEGYGIAVMPKTQNSMKCDKLLELEIVNYYRSYFNGGNFFGFADELRNSQGDKFCLGVFYKERNPGIQYNI